MFAFEMAPDVPLILNYSPILDIRTNDLLSSNGADFGPLGLEWEHQEKLHMGAPLRLSLGNKNRHDQRETPPKGCGKVYKANKNKPMLEHHSENTSAESYF